MNTAIIVAAGSGHRFNAATPKQFVLLLGKPLIFHTLEKFELCDCVDEIVLVLSDVGRKLFQISNFTPEITKLKLIVTGGATRAESVKNGLNSLDAQDGDVVAVHDAARPLVTVDEIARTIRAAEEHGASCLVAPVNDTIKVVSDGKINRTIDRSGLRLALTPQAFRYEILSRAFAGVDLHEGITDECYLVELLDYYYSIITVDGSAQNIKITRPEDLIFAEALLSEPPA